MPTCNKLVCNIHSSFSGVFSLLFPPQIHLRAWIIPVRPTPPPRTYIHLGHSSQGQPQEQPCPGIHIFPAELWSFWSLWCSEASDTLCSSRCLSWSGPVDWLHYLASLPSPRLNCEGSKAFYCFCCCCFYIKPKKPTHWCVHHMGGILFFTYLKSAEFSGSQVKPCFCLLSMPLPRLQNNLKQSVWDGIGKGDTWFFTLKSKIIVLSTSALSNIVTI